jgi:hypothetical protein
MHKRLWLLATLMIIGAAMCLPASAAASQGGYTAKVVYNYCQGADPHFKVKNVAHGWTNANKLTNETWVEQRLGGRNQTWKKVYTWDVAKYTFNANGDKHWLTSWRTWNGDRTHWYRIGFRVRAWHNSTLLSSETIYSRKC